MKQRTRLKQKGYFLRAETAFGFMEAITQSKLPGYWSEDVTTMSHGEGFLHVFDEMFDEPSLNLMDEPEAALSFSYCLSLLALIHRLGRSGAQVICATTLPGPGGHARRRHRRARRRRTSAYELGSARSGLQLASLPRRPEGLSATRRRSAWIIPR